MKIASVAELRARFSAYLKACKDEPILVTKNGKPEAVLLPVSEENEEVERLMLACSPKFQKILRQAKQRIKKTGGIEHDDFWKRIEY